MHVIKLKKDKQHSLPSPDQASQNHPLNSYPESPSKLAQPEKNLKRLHKTQAWLICCSLAPSVVTVSQEESATANPTRA